MSTYTGAQCINITSHKVEGHEMKEKNKDSRNVGLHCDKGPFTSIISCHIWLNWGGWENLGDACYLVSINWFHILASTNIFREAQKWMRGRRFAAIFLMASPMRPFLPLQGPYVAGFASSNLGDVSPNIKGPHCINTGESCENFNNYCPKGGVGIILSWFI